MDLKSFLNKGVKLAFQQASSLALQVTLNKKSGISFDFSSGNPQILTETSVTVPAFELKGSKTDSFGKGVDRQMSLKSLLFKTADVGDLSMYESASINGKEWRMGSVSDFSAELTIAELYREARDV